MKRPGFYYGRVRVGNSIVHKTLLANSPEDAKIRAVHNDDSCWQRAAFKCIRRVETSIAADQCQSIVWAEPVFK